MELLPITIIRAQEAPRETVHFASSQMGIVHHFDIILAWLDGNCHIAALDHVLVDAIAVGSILAITPLSALKTDGSCMK